MLVGMENMMEYFFTEPGYVREILHRIMDFQLAMARKYLSLGVEVVSLGDDLGTPRLCLQGLVEIGQRQGALLRAQVRDAPSHMGAGNVVGNEITCR